MKKLITGLVIAIFLFTGCGIQRGDIKATMVIEGQKAPHDGYNIGPETYVLQGDPIKTTGAVIWIKSLDPNSILGE